MNIKFPKNELIFIEKLRAALLQNDYNKIIELLDGIIEHAVFLNQYCKELLDTYIKILFEKREFEKVVDLVDDLRKKELESCQWYFYAFASLIANKDFTYITRMINKSKLFSDKSIKYLINVDEANYSSIFNLHSELIYSIGPCLILINFNSELVNETLNKKIDDEYVLMRFFDLLNLLFEYGIEDEIIELFEKIIETIYEIPLD